MTYIQGMMAPVRRDKKQAYTDMATQAVAIFRKNGALAVIETWSDDLSEDKINDMSTAVLREADEDVLFTYIIWPSKAAREEGMRKTFADPFWSSGDFNPPMDGKRMFYGGFDPIVSKGGYAGAARYIDGFLLACPTASKEAYRLMAEDAWPMFEKHGAISMYECWGDDIMPGKLTSMEIAVKKEPDETVLFSWIGWPSKAARDAGMAAFHEELPMDEPPEMPFDGKRMIFGGFEVIVDA